MDFTGAAAGLRALVAATAAKSGLRMAPSLTPRTTDWRASSGGAGASQPATRTCWKPCAASSACQLARLISGEPAVQKMQRHSLCLHGFDQQIQASAPVACLLWLFWRAQKS